MIYDTIVIGAGPCGVSAFNYANRLGLNALLVFDLFGGQINYCKQLYSIPSAPNIDSKDLINNYKQLVGEKKTKKDKIERLIKEEKIFCLFGKENKYFSKTVIVCTGGDPFIPNDLIKDITIPYFTYKDYPFSNITSNDNILIIGGGYMGLEIANSIAQKVSKIHIIEKKSSLGGNMFRQEKMKFHKNINVHLNTIVSKIKKDIIFTNNNFKTFSLTGITKIFFAIGIVPNLSFIDIDIVKTKKGIVINKTGDASVINMSKNIEGLFAAGDVVDLPINGFVSMAEGMGIETAKAVQLFLKRNIG